jgi:hypothetical protein
MPHARNAQKDDEENKQWQEMAESVGFLKP